MYSKHLTLLFCGLFVFFSCSNSSQQNQNPSAQSSIEIPELLERSDAIKLGKEWDAVQSFYQKNKLALQQNAQDAEARLKLADVYIKEARVTGEHGHYYPAALEMTDAVILDQPEDQDILFRALAAKSGVLLSLHEFKDALVVGQKAYEQNPYNAQINGVLVDCYVELGQYQKAVAMADNMMKIRPDMRSYSRVSYLREIHGDVDGAKEAMNLAVRAGYPGQEETAWAMLTYGELLIKYGSLDAAEKVFEQILEVRKDYPFAVGAIGEIQYQRGEVKKAEETILRAMEIIPEVGFYTQMAQLYKDQGRNDEFKTIMDEVFVMLQEDVDSGHNMNLEYADIYLHLMNQPEKALEFAKKEYEKRPENIDVNRMMAKVYKKLGKEEMMEKYLTIATSTNSQHPELKEL